MKTTTALNNKMAKYSNLFKILKNLGIFLGTFFILTLMLTVICRDSKHFNGIDHKLDLFLPYALFNRFYFLLVTIVTIGYGDISPASIRSKLFVIILIIVIFVFIFNAIANLQTTVSNQIDFISNKIKPLIK